MSRTIHVNLLKSSERRTSMPIRTRVMVPAAGCLVLLALGLWATLLVARGHSLREGLEDITSKQANLMEANSEYVALAAQEKMARNEIAQFDRYLSGRHQYGAVLYRLAQVVPARMQLTNLDILTPPTPVVPQVKGAAKSAKAKVDLGEAVVIRLAGLADSEASVGAFKAALLSEAFSDLIVRVDIPKFNVSGDKSGLFFFEIECECVRRVFK